MQKLTKTAKREKVENEGNSKTGNLGHRSRSARGVAGATRADRRSRKILQMSHENRNPSETHVSIHTRRTLNVHKTARVGRSSKEKSACTATTEDVHMKCKKSAANPVNKRCAQRQQQKFKGVHTKNRHL
jgi:hypothetical protein